MSSAGTGISQFAPDPSQRIIDRLGIFPECDSDCLVAETVKIHDQNPTFVIGKEYVEFTAQIPVRFTFDITAFRIAAREFQMLILFITSGELPRNCLKTVVDTDLGI